ASDLHRSLAYTPGLYGSRTGRAWSPYAAGVQACERDPRQAQLSRGHDVQGLLTAPRREHARAGAQGLRRRASRRLDSLAERESEPIHDTERARNDWFAGLSVLRIELLQPGMHLARLPGIAVN